MFGSFENDNDNVFGWGATNESSRRHTNPSKNESYEVRRRKNESITRDYFRNIYGEDPWNLGFEVPDWDWN